MTTTDDPLPPLDLSVLARATPKQHPGESGTEDSAPIADPPTPDPLPPISTQSPLRETVSPPTAPRRNARGRTSPGPTAPRKTESSDEIPQQYHPGVLVKPLRELYTMAGTLVLPFNQPVGTALVQNAEQCAIAWDNAAKTDKQIRRLLMMLIQGSTWGQIIAVHMPILMAAAATMIPNSRDALRMVAPDTMGETVNPVSRGS